MYRLFFYVKKYLKNTLTDRVVSVKITLSDSTLSDIVIRGDEYNKQ